MFGEWLNEELKKRGLSQYAFGKMIDVPPTHINHLINGRRKPSAEMLETIAKGLKLPQEEIYRRAGILPQAPPKSEQKEMLNYLFDRFPEKEKKDLLTYMRIKLMMLEEEKTKNASKRYLKLTQQDTMQAHLKGSPVDKLLSR